jgi:hypothetical protein
MTLMRLFVLLSVFLIASTVGFAFPQGDFPDDAYQQDTSRVNEMIKTTKRILYMDPDSSSKLIDSILDLSIKNEYPHGLYNGYNLRANILLM